MRKAVGGWLGGSVGISKVVLSVATQVFGGDAPWGTAGPEKEQSMFSLATRSLAQERGCVQNNKRDADQQGKNRRGDEP